MKNASKVVKRCYEKLVAGDFEEGEIRMCCWQREESQGT